jgi:glucosyl-dolichyl phosphate glucuronosyltransferase
VIDVTVLIATFNRAELLGETLDVLAAVDPPGARSWEVVVIDNNSRDRTRNTVESRQRVYPVPLRYIFEPRQGRSAALNTGHRLTTAPFILYTDDDVRVAPGWLRVGAEALAEGWDYIGGPVDPLWQAPRPAWLHEALHGTIAILDYGTSRFVFEDRQRVPLGANMGVRRDLLNRIGGFREDLGRSDGRKILGQEVPDLLARARAIRARGLYLPEFRIEHHVPAQRLTKAYFRRWWYGKGVSKATLELRQPLTELGLDLRREPHIGPLPRFMVGEVVRGTMEYARALIGGDQARRFQHEMMLAYAAGYVAGRGLSWRRPSYRESDHTRDGTTTHRRGHLHQGSGVSSSS